jgi:hypothetical protein
MVEKLTRTAGSVTSLFAKTELTSVTSLIPVNLTNSEGDFLTSESMSRGKQKSREDGRVFMRKVTPWKVEA